MTEQKNISYLNKNFLQYKASLIEFARNYFPNTYTDFSEASPGTMFIEMSSYVGDVLSFYTDTQIQENFVLTAEQKENLLNMASPNGNVFNTETDDTPSTPTRPTVLTNQLLPRSNMQNGLNLNNMEVIMPPLFTSNRDNVNNVYRQFNERHNDDPRVYHLNSDSESDSDEDPETDYTEVTTPHHPTQLLLAPLRIAQINANLSQWFSNSSREIVFD
jgi:hypothetical protein